VHYVQCSEKKKVKIQVQMLEPTQGYCTEILLKIKLALPFLNAAVPFILLSQTANIARHSQRCCITHSSLSQTVNNIGALFTHAQQAHPNSQDTLSSISQTIFM
jgi:hypothetical protein